MINELTDSEKQFQLADFTAVLSDLHLTEAQEPIEGRPLWKKYKTKEFFFDDDFAKFLKELKVKALSSQKNKSRSLGDDEFAGSQKESQPIPTVELVLAGDVFDFDSVTALPKAPTYRISNLERSRGLRPEEEKSVFKIRKIIDSHFTWFKALSDFIKEGNRVVFIIGNHDLELHFLKVQKEILRTLELNDDELDRIRFTEFFYISNKDTLIEHGNQYDPFCLIPDPVSPFLKKFDRIEIRIPFGNLATRYLVNVMGFFNPYVESNYIMTAGEYVKFFFKYIVKFQPLIMLTWIWSATLILYQTFLDSLMPVLREPLEFEGRIEQVAKRSNATPRMVRELRSLTAESVTSKPWLALKELWLDRAFIVLLAFIVIFQLFLFIDSAFDIAIFWTLIPLSLFAPFFIFYSRTVTSEIPEYKKPKERILTMASLITGVNRIIHGHTHIVRHEIIGPIEHLNSGTWSPAFTDVECSVQIAQKTYVWLSPSKSGARTAELFEFVEGASRRAFGRKPEAQKLPNPA